MKPKGEQMMSTLYLHPVIECKWPTFNICKPGSRYIFLEFSNPREANEAVKATNGYKLDKAHTFIVNLFSDFDKYATVSDDWEPPTPKPYKESVS